MRRRDAPEPRLLVTARTRGRGRLDDDLGPPPPDPPVETLAALTTEPWLTGGEPTLRADLPALVEAMRPAGMITDGLALDDPEALGPLREAGLVRLRVLLHAARPDAHDWLVGHRGAARRAARALRTARALGIGTEIAAVITRPTLPHLPELAELAGALGAERLQLRPLAPARVAEDEQIALVPRLAQTPAALEATAQAAARRAIAVDAEGFARCAAPPELRVADPRWYAAEGFASIVAALEPEGGPRCAGCPGPPICAGIPDGYVRRFGDHELRPPSGSDMATIRFGAPPTVACRVCGEADREPDAPEPTRDIRLRLVRAARGGASALRVASASSLAHPSAAALLREARLLGFARIEVAAEVSALDAMDDATLYQLRAVDRIDAALYGPTAEAHDAHVGRSGALAEAQRGLERVAAIAGVEVGAHAVLHDPSLDGYDPLFRSLSCAPVFRLSSQGDRLDSLANAARRAPPAVAAAVSPLLPGCLRDSEDGREPTSAAPPQRFAPCTCEGNERRCPGIAVGWRLDDGD